MPPVGDLDQLAAAKAEDGIVQRVRTNPRWMIAIAVAAVLLAAWIAWAIYVASSKGATAGLGVVLAWPAMIVALALISLPFIGGYLLIRRLSDGAGSAADTEATDKDEELEEEDPQEESEDDEDEEDDDSDVSDEEETEDAKAG